MIRFHSFPDDRMEKLLKLLTHLHDDETIAMLLKLSQTIDSFDLFEKKVAELAVRKS